MSDKAVVTQNLRDFTVQIRKLSNEKIVGTGIAVSLDGKIITCRHVVDAAGVDPMAKDGGIVGIYFPQKRANGKNMRRAKVAAFFSEYDDDIVLLQLLDGPAPLAPEQMPILGQAEYLSQGNCFRSYGYRNLDDYIVGWCEGNIRGPVEDPQKRKLQAEPVQLKSSEIDEGMSGSGVLDLKRNLVIGVISEAWFSDKNGKDRDTAWAVDAQVLSFDPLGLSLQNQALPKREAPAPTIMATVVPATTSQHSKDLSHAPNTLAEWVGREDLLRQLDCDWLNPDRKVTSLIGFGGEGKSSMARRWLDGLMKKQDLPQPQRVFWWEFSENQGLDDFFASALTFFSDRQLDPRDYHSITAKAHMVAGMFINGRHLLVLDGLEVLQHPQGDRTGEVISQDLREFLMFLAASGHHSFSLITSRIPLVDLLNYTTYGERVVGPLNTSEGLELLRLLEVKGEDRKLAEVVAQWEGHALTLSVVGGFLKEKYRCDIKGASELTTSSIVAARYEWVQRVLGHYDYMLASAEREFLIILSAFRPPVLEGAWNPVFRREAGEYALNKALSGLDTEEFNSLLSHLQVCQLLHYNKKTRGYTTHPLIKEHYKQQLEQQRKMVPETSQVLHRLIKDYYLSIAAEPGDFPTLEELMPYIEAVHHACAAEDFDEANYIRLSKIYQKGKKVLIYQLGAHDTALGLWSDFFPGGDMCRDTQVTSRENQGIILNDIGLSLTALGRLAEAVGFYQRSLIIKKNEHDQRGAQATYRNLAELYIHLGELALARQAATQANRLAHQRNDVKGQRNALFLEAWLAHLRGDKKVKKYFWRVEAIQRGLNSEAILFYGFRGIRHAEYLWRIGNLEAARKEAEANREVCNRNHWQMDLSGCYRILGKLSMETGRESITQEYYQKALDLARSITRRDILIEALAARGCWLTQYGETFAARRDLEEGLEYATISGYRIYEVDLRVGLAWCSLKEGQYATARQETDLAMSMSHEIGYYWGEVGAKEVLDALKN